MNNLSAFIKECHSQLINGKDRESEIARRYLLNDRKLLDKSLKCHTIGYCRNDCKIPDPIRFYGTYDKNESERWNISRKIRGRIIVPIFDEFGEVVAFATRVPTTEPGNPWWNLPSPFKKGNHLFLLDKARREVFAKNKIYIVEGYADAYMLYQHGVKNVVAIMGTALSLRKVGLIARYCNNVCLCFDTDENDSGGKAKRLSTVILQKFNFCDEISVIDTLPMKEDPASFVSENGIDKFLAMERILDEEEIQKICVEVMNGNNKALIDAK